jgi:hypothetical protein
MRRRARFARYSKAKTKQTPAGEEKMQHAKARRHRVGAFHHFPFDAACAKALNLRGSS